MSSSTPGHSSASPSDFKSILDGALSEYEKKTGKPLFDDRLAAELRGCESVDDIMAILRGRFEAFQEFRNGDQRSMKWLGPTVNVLSAFSDTLGEGVSLIRQQYPGLDDYHPNVIL